MNPDLPRMFTMVANGVTFGSDGFIGLTKAYNEEPIDNTSILLASWAASKPDGHHTMGLRLFLLVDAAPVHTELPELLPLGTWSDAFVLCDHTNTPYTMPAAPPQAIIYAASLY